MFSWKMFKPIHRYLVLVANAIISRFDKNKNKIAVIFKNPNNKNLEHDRNEVLFSVSWIFS